MTKAKLVSLLKGLARAAGGAALLGGIAYLKGVQATDPALYGAAIIALVDVYQVLKQRGVVSAEG